MPQIPLTKDQFSLVDDIDYDAVLAVGKWCYRSGYAVHYWKDANGVRHTLYLHRFIYARILDHAIPAGLQIDHCSAREKGQLARLDNQRSNLRLATRSQNQAAKKAQVNTRSHKGCTLRQGKFDVRMRYHWHRLHLGHYADFDVAVAVYAYAHRLLWKDFTSENPLDAPLPEAILDKVHDRIARLIIKLKA